MAAATRAVPLARRHYKTHGVLSPSEWAQIIAQEAHALGVKMTPKEVAEGVGVVMAESSGNASNLVQGPSGHIGGWSEEPSYGSTAERLDPHASTRAAIKNWLGNGKSFWPAWGKWEAEQSGRSGTSEWKKYLPDAERALGGAAQSTPGVLGRPPSPKEEEEASPSEDLMHVGLVAVLVLGGVAMVGLGATRFMGSAQR